MTPAPTTRISIASLAVIRRIDEAGVTRYLAQWNPKWDALNSVGGHTKDGESFRACLVREIAEELGVYPPPDDPDGAALPPVPQSDVPRYTVGPWSLGLLEYEAFSKSANVMTRYTIALFEVHLSPEAVAHVSQDAKNAWLSETEFDAGKAADGRSVSETMRRHLDWLRERRSPQIPVCWLIGPENRLREAMSERVAGQDGEEWFRMECGFVARRLRLMFPRAQALVIRDRLEGFRRRTRPHKLLVEVVPADALDDRASPAPGVWCCREVYLVKVGDTDTLEEEWRGWRWCRPPGSDSILSSLQDVRVGNRLVGLIYGDATNAIGGTAMSLERAVRDCCRHGTPTLESLVFTLKRLFGRLNDRFYRRSFSPKNREDHLGVQRPASSPIRLAEKTHPQHGRITQLRARLEEAIGGMSDKKPSATTPPTAPAQKAEPPTLSDQERRRLRRETLAGLVVGHRPTFLDPFDYLELVLAHPANADLVPDMLVGASHGDLHGRNVLVAKLEDDVGSVAVFDYGDMHLGNYIAWDFVKMETELKARVYADLFPAERRAFIGAVHSFEFRLAERTENIHHNRAKPEDAKETDKDLERLARLLLEIRRLASKALGHDRNRPHLWLEEYYFMLLCYGSYAMHFPTYGTAEFLAAYVSAGTAACRLSFPYRRLFGGIDDAIAAASSLIPPPPPSPPGPPNPAAVAALCGLAKGTATFAALDGMIGHHARLRFLLVWASVDAAKHPAHLAAAVELLGELRIAFPHALEVVEVLFLAFLQQNAPEKVESEMAALSRLHVDLPYEIECRMGRVFRQRGTKAWPAGQPMPLGTADDFRRSLQIYERAWQQSQHYYPGGNVAGLKLLLGDQKKAREIADRVLASAREAPADDLWARIAQADMLYLLGRDDEAERQYRDTLPLCPPQGLESSLRQLDLLLRVEPTRRSFWDRAKLIALFGPDAFGKL